MQLNGELSKVSLPNLIQLVKNGELTGRITLMQGARVANIFVEHGDIVHADIEGFTGREALFELFLWVTGTFSFAEIELGDKPRTLNPARPEDSMDRLLREGINYLEQKKYLEQLRITGDTVLALTGRIMELKNEAHGNPRLAGALTMIQPVVVKIDGKTKLSEALKEIVMSRRAYAQVLAIILAEGIATVVEKPIAHSGETIDLPTWVIARLKQDDADLTRAIINMVIWVDRVKCWMYQADVDFAGILDSLESVPASFNDDDHDLFNELKDPVLKGGVSLVLDQGKTGFQYPLFGAASLSDKGGEVQGSAKAESASSSAPKDDGSSPRRSSKEPQAHETAETDLTDTESDTTCDEGDSRTPRSLSPDTSNDEAVRSVEF